MGPIDIPPLSRPPMVVPAVLGPRIKNGISYQRRQCMDMVVVAYTIMGMEVGMEVMRVDQRDHEGTVASIMPVPLDDGTRLQTRSHRTLIRMTPTPIPILANNSKRIRWTTWVVDASIEGTVP